MTILHICIYIYIYIHIYTHTLTVPMSLDCKIFTDDRLAVRIMAMKSDCAGTAKSVVVATFGVPHGSLGS